MNASNINANTNDLFNFNICIPERRTQ